MADTPDLRPLHDGPVHPFSEFRSADIPANIAGVYTIWDHEGNFLYVGVGGTRVRYQEPGDESEPSKPVKGLQGRLKQHHSGDRSSDRFCLLVFDCFVLQTLTREQMKVDPPSALVMNNLTRDYIRANLGFRWLEFRDGKTAESVEDSIQKGALPVGKPLLNPA